MLNLDQILTVLGITDYYSSQEINGGTDSKVYKVVVSPEVSYAVRLLPAERLHQFHQERKMINRAKVEGVPVPKVHNVIEAGQFSVMLMEWGKGETIFSALHNYPEKSYIIGVEFGKSQASIHNIPIISSESPADSWLSPSVEETEIIRKIPPNEMTQSIIHLDYHPLNVLTDGEKVTAVIDWTNAAIGDFRFDISRTFSILRLMAPNHFQGKMDIILNFERGWKEGYEKVRGSFELLDSMSLFHAWSGLRLIRDLEGDLDDSDRIKIQHWVNYWLTLHHAGEK